MITVPEDEVERFRTFLLFLGLDQSTTLRTICSWTFFVIFSVAVPVIHAVCVSCDKCENAKSRSFHLLVEFSESALAAVSFLCLSNVIRKFGLRKVLFLDKVSDDSIDVRRNYETELNNCFKLLGWILFPCIVVELLYQVWSYHHFSLSIDLPYFSKDPLFNNFLCFGTVLGWLYKSVVFLCVCVIFKLMCSLQILRLQGYIKLLEETTDVVVILQEHLRIREQLSIISHRFRVFIVLSMLMITCSQLYSLFVLSDSRYDVNFVTAGDLLVCSVVQLSGFVICLYGAVKITHRAQEIKSVVTQWHAIITCNCKPSTPAGEPAIDPQGNAHLLDFGRTSDLEASINLTRRPPSQSIQNFEDFHRRQAFVYYLQNSKPGISLFGYVLDRGFLYAVFGIELTLSLFILGETVLSD